MSLFNFKEIEKEAGTGYDPIPEDRYTLKVEEAKQVKTKDGTKDMLKVTFVVDDAKSKFKNRKLWHQITMTPKSKIVLFSFLKALQSPLIESEKDVSLEDIIADIQGRSLSAFVEVSLTTTGKEVNSAKEFKPVEGQTKTEKKGNSLFS